MDPTIRLLAYSECTEKKTGDGNMQRSNGVGVIFTENEDRRPETGM